MNLTCRLETGQSTEVMRELFKDELKRTHERSSITINDGGVFIITAKDVRALRAAMNSVTSILSVYEQTNDN